MNQLLIVGEAILAVGPFEVSDDDIRNDHTAYPLHVISGWQIVEADLMGRQYHEFEWIDGQLAEKAPAPQAPPVVPREVSRRRGLQALYKMYSITETAIEAKIVEAITNPDEQYLALTEFRTSQTFERHRALVVMMGTMLDLDLDALFILASNIP